jgi:hypothetical protein
VMTRLALSPRPGDLLSWLRSMRARREPFSQVLPWLTFDAIRAIDRHLKPGSRLFEYGCGHSTVYWAGRGVTVHAVERDPGWHARTSRILASAAHASVRLAGDEHGYVHGIDAVDGDFDAVLVDGDWRLACIDAAVPRIRPGGMLVVDNTDWHWFADVDRRVPAGWHKTVHAGCAPFIGYPSETTLWTRPLA